LVNINPNYQSDELAFTLEKVGVSVLFLNDRFKGLDYIKVAKNIVPDIEEQNPYDLRSSKLPSLKSIVRINDKNDQIKGFVNYTDLSQPVISSLLKYDTDCNDPVNIQFTSGTTGRPKAATLSHYNILNNAYIIGNKCRYTSKDNIAIPVPFYHCFGMIMGTLAAMVRGGGITIITEGFDSIKTLEAADKYKCTSLYGVPTMFI
jgi:fatty-acyl-CoA synthase